MSGQEKRKAGVAVQVFAAAESRAVPRLLFSAVPYGLIL
jgi:hypothetical protein